MKKNNDKGICIITLSDNYDHQEVAFSMFNQLYPKYKNIYNIGLINQKNPHSPNTKNSFYFDGPKRPGINRKTFDFITLIKIIKTINNLPVEYIYFESEHIWNSFIMLFIKKKFKTVAVIHDVIPHSDSKGKKLANKVICRLADCVLIRNKKYEDKLIELYNVKKENIIIMPLWRYYPQKRVNGNNTRFLFFGRIRKYKGIDSMLEIAKKCPNIQFDVVGKPDEESKITVEKLKKLNNVNVDENEVDDIKMEEYFKAAAAIILPYETATQSGVIVDSYKYSKPVIAYDVGAISEQVSNEVSGFLIKNGEIDDFVNRIEYIDSLSKIKKEELQSNAYDFGYKLYSVQENSKEFITRFL